MKKLTLVLGLALILAAASGCSKKDSSAETQGSGLDDVQVEVGSYEGLSVEIDKIEDVTDKDIQEQLESIIASAPALKSVTDRAVAEGDLVNVDYEGFIGGEAISGSAEKDYNIMIGSGIFFDGAESQLIGAMPGQTVDVSVTYPDSYPDASMAGKEAVYKVTVNAIQEEGEAELTDAYIQSISDCSTVDEFKAMLKKQMQEGVEAQRKLTKEQGLWDKLIAQTKIDNIPQAEIEKRAEVYKAYDREMADNSDMDFEAYLSQFMQMSLEAYNTMIDSQVEAKLKKELIAKAIAGKENITVGEITDAVWESCAEQYGYDDAEQFKKDNPEETFKTELLIEKVTDFLMQSAVFTEK